MRPDPSIPDSLNPGQRRAQQTADMERRLRRLETFLQGGVAGRIPPVDVLPPPGRKGRIRYLTTDDKVYVDIGSSWVPQT